MDIVWNVVILGSVVLFWIAVFACIEIAKKRTDIKEIEVTMVSQDETSRVPELLETVVTESLQDWIALNMINREAGAITKKEEQEIIKGVTSFVLKRMSNAIQIKLASYYNHDSIDTIIAEKIFMTVTNFVVNNNYEFARDDDEAPLDGNMTTLNWNDKED